MRPHLVIVRAGDKSLHPEWLKGGGERNWDLVVNYYGDDPDLYREPEIQRIDSKSIKWPALHDLITSHPNLIEGRRYIWFPDDDLLITKDGINRFFDICAQYDLDVAQPALTWDSYYSHLVTLRNTRTQLRFTNYIEVMAPCFSVDVFRKVLPVLGAAESGWGLDYLWQLHAKEPTKGIGVVDDVTMKHTRPLSGPRYAWLPAGSNPWDELRSLCQAHGVVPMIKTHGAIMRDGRYVSALGRERLFGLELVAGYIWAITGVHDPRRLARRLAGASWKALSRRPDLVVER